VSGGSQDDRRWLARAVGLAAAALPACRPNPPVGCVLVRDGEVVGEGWTAPVGGPHAEVVALAAAGERARGATAYVSLEPCDHTGRTGPCSRALLAAGVARVVHALEDPDPDASGGAATLRAAGVPTTLLSLDGWERRLPAAFLHDRATGLPEVTCKLAVTPAGAHVAPAGRWITGAAARRRVHRQRAAADAVLVGVGTVLADDPRLDVRHVQHAGPQPRPVVLDTRLRTPVGAAVVARGALFVAGVASDPTARERLVAAGAEVVVVASGEDGRLDLAAALAAVRRADVQVLYAEPGPTLGSALVAEGLVARVVVHVGGASPAQAVAALSRVPLPLAGLVLDRVVRLGADVELALVPPDGPG
jgi:diaminohydroxyphosphoribosylaminopyrimidine deaminase/5-amino-6-(5-phosphoribosylamino)uracil reductase